MEIGGDERQKQIESGTSVQKDERHGHNGGTQRTAHATFQQAVARCGERFNIGFSSLIRKQEEDEIKIRSKMKRGDQEGEMHLRALHFRRLFHLQDRGKPA